VGDIKAVSASLTDSTVKAALDAIESDMATLPEKIEMLIEMAAGLQSKPKSPQQIEDAIFLYCRAIELCPPENPLLRGRGLTGMGTALRIMPAEGPEFLLEAKAAYDAALPILQEHAAPEEIAETQMNLGVVIQALVPFHKGILKNAIQAYQRAARVFNGQNYPQEFAIIQNNIAIAYLSLPLAAEGEGMRQGMAVQSFEEALKWVNLIDYPSEYAMLQNNLANALQYLPTIHPIENNLKALAAYDEALKVRTAQDTPIEYANTISNKANVLFNLPDDIEYPEKGNLKNLMKAKAYYQEAYAMFREYEQWEQAEIVKQAMQEVEKELQTQLTINH
jgi:tetratricopeptide (TPR) repeat protein